MSNIFPIDFEEKLTMAQDDYILFSDSEDGNKIKKAQYKNLKGEPGTPGTPGKDGEDGAAATITVGSTTTGAAGSSASVTNSGTSSAAVLDFTIPQGAKGEPGEDGQDGADGAAATITVGTTTTLPAGSSATVTNVGTSQDAILNFGIPKGDSGTGSGDVIGPASSTDGHLAVFDGATGKLIKDGGPIPTGDVGVSTDTGTLLSAGVDLWLGTETDFSSISTPDTNTLYIQYKSDGGGGWTPGVNTVAYWSFNNTLDDGSTNSYDLTVSGGSYTYGTGVSQECLTKGQKNQGFTNSSLTESAFSGNFTLMFFVNFSQIDAVMRIMGGYSNYSNIQYESGKSGLQWYNNSEVGRTSWSWTPSANTWYHIAITGDGTGYTAYLDGTAMTKLNQGSIAQGGGTIIIGNNYTSTESLGMAGSLDEIIIEDKIWTQQEIQDYLSNFTY